MILVGAKAQSSIGDRMPAPDRPTPKLSLILRTFDASSGYTLFAQHDARWIRTEPSGINRLTIFNNGPGRFDGRYSSIDEIVLPITPSGGYRLEKGKAYEPTEPAWGYTAEKKADFFSSHISGAERLPNGNTLICDGEKGRIFEVTTTGKTVLDYVSPYLEREVPDDDKAAPPSRQKKAEGEPQRGPPPCGGIFRATRVATDHPGIKVILRHHQSR